MVEDLLVVVRKLFLDPCQVNDAQIEHLNVIAGHDGKLTEK